MTEVGYEPTPPERFEAFFRVFSTTCYISDLSNSWVDFSIENFPRPKCPEKTCPEINCPKTKCPDLKCVEQTCPVLKCPHTTCPALECPEIHCPECKNNGEVDRKNEELIQKNMMKITIKLDITLKKKKIRSILRVVKHFLSTECSSDPSLNPYIHKRVFAHDVIDQNTTRTGYSNRYLVCPDIEYKDDSNLVRCVIQTPVAHKIEDRNFGQNITDLITL